MSATIFEDWIYEHAEYRKGFDMLAAEIDRVLAGGAPFIFPLIGDSRAGKTALLGDIASRYAAALSLSGHPKVLLTTMPAAASNEALALQINEQLIGPLAIQGSIAQILRRSKGTLKGAGVKVLMVDEFNHLIEKRSTQRAQTKSNRFAADWMKELYDEAGISVVISGLTHVARMYSDNDQLENRGLRGARIHPYAWASAQDRGEFMSTIAAAAAHFKEHGWKVEVDLNLLSRVTYLGGGGYIGKARDYLARMDEVGQPHKRLTRELLSRVYKEKYGFDAKGDPLSLKAIDDVMLNGAHRAAVERALRSGGGAR